jgi:hypothetical protein
MPVRFLWMIAGAAIAGVLTLLWPAPSQVPAGLAAQTQASVAGATAQPPLEVRVQHQLVSADTVVQEPVPTIRSAARMPRSATQQMQANAGVVTRARRLLFGDGRYRPEPFPTAPR